MKKVRVIKDVTIMINGEPRGKNAEFSIEDENLERIQEFVEVTGEGEIIDADFVEDPTDMKVKDLKEKLDELGIEYPKSAVKDDLVKLLEERLTSEE